MLHRASVNPLGLRRITFTTLKAAHRHASELAAPHSQTIDALLRSSSARSSIVQHVEVNGFVRSVRKQKRVAFAALGDGSNAEPLQVVLTPEQAEPLSNGAAVRVSGKWAPSPGGKQQAYELQAERISILGSHDASSYPIQKKYQSPEFLRTLPHLRSRLPLNNLLLRLRSQVIASLTTYFAAQDFVQTHTPVITSSDCEGAGEVFSVTTNEGLQTTDPPRGHGGHFFRSPKYLTVSAQLHLEALAQSVSKVWTLSPTFRAEKSDTPRHLSEFYMLEAELCFVDDMGKIMDLIEDMLIAVTSTLQKSRLGEQLLEACPTDGGNEQQDTLNVSRTELESRWRGLATSSWPRITYKHAVGVLRAAVQDGVEFIHEPSLGASLQAEHEKYLARRVGQGQPLFVTDYPKEVKAFYMLPTDTGRIRETGADTVACFDLLVPDVCELAGGSMREHREDALLEAMLRQGIYAQPSEGSTHSPGTASAPQDLTEKALDWYMDLRRYGSVPHGGFGLGFDRLLSYLSGASNIRDVVTFPRWYGRCDC